MLSPRIQSQNKTQTLIDDLYEMDISYVQGVPLLLERIQGEDSDFEEEDPSSTLKR